MPDGHQVHQGGADIRFIQRLLGHEKLETTAIYTEVSIVQLQAVHAKTHPAETGDAAPDRAPDPLPLSRQKLL